jgi:hypothetical protein
MRFGVDQAAGIRYFIDEHPRPDGAGHCTGSGRLLYPSQDRPDDGKAYWTVLSDDPLTLTPSLLCPACGDHGWVSRGAWVPS